MENNFVELASVSSLDDFVAQSNGSAGVLFKHSNSCGVSSRGYDEMSKLRQPVGLVVVQRARQVSDEIESRWHVTHETPQVLIVLGGEVVWSASHFDVKAQAVETALQKVSGGQ
jgi:bacillithiol system protein YtxJ